MISYRFVPISSQRGYFFLRHPVVKLTNLKQLNNFINPLGYMKGNPKSVWCHKLHIKLLLKLLILLDGSF